MRYLTVIILNLRWGPLGRPEDEAVMEIRWLKWIPCGKYNDDISGQGFVCHGRRGQIWQPLRTSRSTYAFVFGPIVEAFAAVRKRQVPCTKDNADTS